MAQHYENKTIEGAVELLRVNGFDGLADAVTVLLNSAMVAERSDYLGVFHHLQQNAGHYVPTMGMRGPVAADIRAIFNAVHLHRKSNQKTMCFCTQNCTGYSSQTA